MRVLERVMAREFGADDVVVCYPDDIDRFIGPDTKIVALSTHNPLGVTFAAGVYTSIFGSSREPINSHYAKLLFERSGPIRIAPRSGCCSAGPGRGRSRRPTRTSASGSTA